jgi:hypothetical protein
MKMKTAMLTMKPMASMIVILAAIMTAPPASAGVLDPDCTATKAAKSAAAKATVGVGGRCSPAEAAKDTAKRESKVAVGKLGPDGKNTNSTKGNKR